MTTKVDRTIELDVPVRTAYNQWTQFESFPKFLDEVESIAQIDDTHTHWKVKVAGVEREFDAEITEQHPDERVAWNSTGGETEHAGVVTFHKLSPRLTRIELSLDIAPHGPIEKIGRGMRFTKRAVRADLHRFKAYAEMNDA